MSYDDYHWHFKRALDDEIKKMREAGGQKSYLSDGRYLGVRNGFYIYSFIADTELKFPDETPIDLEYQGRKHPGLILSIDGFDIVLALQEHIGESIASAILYTEPWFLLEKLKDRLDVLKECPEVIQKRAVCLLDETTKTVKPALAQAKTLLHATEQQVSERLAFNDYQLEAVGHVLTNEVSFVWGPPGTGKTKTLGLTVAALVQAGKSLLVVAHSNVAVDVAMLSVAKNLHQSPEYRAGKILRYGVTYLPELDQKFPKLNVRGVVREQNPALMQQIETLENEKTRLTRKARDPKLSPLDKSHIKDRLTEIKQALQPLYQKLKDLEKGLIQQAKVVGCTLSKATIADSVYERVFDAVLIDEASMAYIPHCIFVSSLARQHSAIFGDFRQLAPISQADTPHTRRWLERDVFEEAGITDKVNLGQKDPRLVLLAIQYRMHPHISAVPNQLFYKGLLQDGPNVLRDTKPIVQSRPESGQALVIYDLSNICALCFSDNESHSRFNLISALMSMQLAYAIISTSQRHIGIVTPYRAQSRLVRRMLTDLNVSNEQVYVATVHRFQGSENDVIIFDTVEGPPKQKAGRLVIGGVDSTAMRLANVAVSRAKGKFITLVNYDYIQFNLSFEDSFRQLIESVASRTPPKKTSWASPMIVDLPGVTYYPHGQMASSQIKQDLLAAKEEIAIFWSDQLHSYHFPVTLLSQRDPTKVRVYVRGKGSAQFDFGLKNAQIWRDQSSLPIGVVGIDRERLWVYVDPEDSKGPVLRLDLPNTTKLLYGFWQLIPEDAGKQTTQQKIKAGKGPVGMPCPECGNPLMPETGKYGPYMKCTVCSYTKRITAKDATEYARLMGLFCEDCGGQAVGRDGRSGIFLGCINYPNCKWTKNLRSIV